MSTHVAARYNERELGYCSNKLKEKEVENELRLIQWELNHLTSAIKATNTRLDDVLRVIFNGKN